MNIRTLSLATALLTLSAVAFAQETKPVAPAVEAVAAQAGVIQSTDGYPLGTCVLSGEKLKKGKMKVVEVEGRTIKVCCGNCAKKVKKDPARFIKKLDAAIVAQQSAHYPLTKCPVSGDKLVAGDTVNAVIGGRLVKLCCRDCITKAKANAKAIASKITTAAYAQQIAMHKGGKGLTCPVSKKPADRKGKAQMILHGNTLVAVCCKNCLKAFKANPNKYLASAGSAAKPASRPAHEHEENEEHEDHEHK